MFNWSEVHFSGSTSYEIHTLVTILKALAYCLVVNNFTYTHAALSYPSFVYRIACCRYQGCATPVQVTL